METTIHHIAIAVPDLDRALAFYRDLLGFKMDWDMDHRSGESLSRVVGLENADTHIIMLKGYGFRLELFHYHHPKGRDRGLGRQCDFGLTHFALKVQNIHRIYERLAAAGVEFNCPPQNLRPGIWATYLKGTEGVTIELIQYSQVL